MSAPETPGSIHEGGELGYALVARVGAAFDNPDLIVVVRRGRWRGRRRARLRPAGTPTIPQSARDGACCRSCTSTVTRSRARPFSPASRARSSSSSATATATSRASWKAMTRPRCTPQMAATLEAALDGDSSASSTTRAQTASTASALADDRHAHAQGLDGTEVGRRQARGRHVPLAPGAPSTSASESGARRDAGGMDEELQGGGALRRHRAPRAGTRRAVRPRAPGAWARIPSPTAALLRAICACRTSGTTPSRSAARRSRRGSRRASGTASCAT